MYYEELDETWDFCPEALDDENFLSWFTRLAKENCSDTNLLFQRLLPQKTYNKILKYLNGLNYKSELQNQLITKLKPFTHVPLVFINNINNINEIHGYKPIKPIKPIEDLEDYSFNFLNTPYRNTRYCPYCLKEDQIPYFRQSWCLKFITVCQEHNCLLFENCESCGVSIRYWRTRWDQPTTVCYNCETSLIEDLCFTTRTSQTGRLQFQEILIDVYNTKQFQQQKVDPEYFFQQLWKLICVESSDLNITSNPIAESSISPIRMFQALSLAMCVLNSDPERIDKPYICKNDMMIFETESDLLSHQQSNCPLKIDQTSLTPNQLDIMKIRFKIIQPLLVQQNRNKKDIEKVAGDRAISTIYRWIQLYEKDGITALAPKNHLKGRRRGFPSDIERIITDIAKSGITKNSSIKAEWIKFQDNCLEIGFPQSEIPSYGTFNRRIKEVLFLDDDVNLEN